MTTLENPPPPQPDAAVNAVFPDNPADNPTDRGDSAPVEGDLSPANIGGLGMLIGLVALVAVAGGRGALLALGGFALLIFMHELGHFVAARRAGMKATEFFFGFGPRIFSFKRGETEYGVKAIPAGAYVKIVGMNNLDPVDPGDEGRAYRQGSFLRKLSVVLAGPIMNLSLAFLGLIVLFTAYGFVGFDTLVEGPDPENWVVGQVAETDGLGHVSAAAQMGLQEGDRIVDINGTPINSWYDLSDLVTAADAGSPIDLIVERDGATFAASGILGTAVDEETGATRPLIGVGVEFTDLNAEPLGVIDAIGASAGEFGEVMSASAQGLASLAKPSTWAQMLGLPTGEDVAVESDEPVRPTDPPASNEVDFFGPIGIIDSARGAPALQGLLLLWVMVNAFVGLFNLLPLLPFDGGHAVVAIYERIRSIGGKRHTVDFNKLMPLTYGVVSLLLVMFVAVTSRDLFRIVERIGG